MWCLRANPAIIGWRQRLGVAALNRFAERLHHGGKLKQQLIDTVTNSSIDDLNLAGKELCAPSGKPPSAGGRLCADRRRARPVSGLRGPLRPPEHHPNPDDIWRFDCLLRRFGSVQPSCA
jgi:hypothetical protein